ncbi:MAG: putative nucleotidyltransferase substrate binding domain-containing protein [Campylobacterota bacterium]
MSILEQKTFLQNIPPFDNLIDEEIELLSHKLNIEYFQNDTFIIDGNNEEQNLYFIIKGKVQELNPDNNEVISIFADNEFFDPLSLIEHRTKNYFKTLEECICYVLPQEVFLKVVYQNEKLEHFFFQSISQKLSVNIGDTQNKELANLMVARVGDAYLQKPLYVDANETIYNTVKYMKENNLSSILVKDDTEFAIATDTDFREKVILNRLSYDDAVRKICSYGLRYVNDNDFLFNAQLIMTRFNIKRLIVKDKEENIVGILDQMSLTSFFSSHTYAVANEIDKALDIEELKQVSQNFIKIIKALYAKGVKVRYISKLLNELNKKLFEKIFTLLAPQGLLDNAALLVLGSEGRGEQILRTDQDNALIIADGCALSDEEVLSFTAQFTDTLIEFGYPRCKGDIMVSNPFWTKRYDQFAKQIEGWINRKEKEDFMNLAIFVDATCVVGDKKLLKELKKHTLSQIDRSAFFFTTFASFALTFATPLGLFNDFVVEKNENKNKLDLKKGGIFPLVHGIRTMALEQNIFATNTIDRIKALYKKGVLDKEFASELTESFNFLITLRLKASLQKLDRGDSVDNLINPNSLTTLEKDMLRDTFKIVNRFKKYLTSKYRLEYV